MPRKYICSDEQIIEELKKGTAEATVGKLCHCHQRRVHQVKEKWEATTGEKIVLKDKKYKCGRPENLILSRDNGSEERNHQEGWVNYMQNNPHYFQWAFGIAPTRHNIVEIASDDEIISTCLGI